MYRNGFLLQIICLLVLSFAQSLSAGEIYNFYDGARGLGMGGAQIAAVNDETALLINPAALGKLRDFYLTLADPEVEINHLAAKTLVEEHGYPALMDPQETVLALQEHKDEHYHVGAKIFPSFVLSNFGIGFFGIETHDAEYNSTKNKIYYTHRRDTGVALGYNLRIFDGIIKLGVATRAFDRIEADAAIVPTTVDLTMDRIASNGAALAADGALILTAPIMFLPSITGVVHDIGGTEFSLAPGMMYPLNTEPRGVRQSVDVGASMSPILANHVRLTIAAELRDITQTDDDERDNVYRRIHAGTELNIADFVFLRGGWNQRYWTAGFELTTRFFQLQATTYGEDVGTPKAAREDRRYMLKASLRF